MKLNIYYTEEQRIKLDAICRKYEVSKSTIAENLLFLFTKYLLREEKRYIIEMLGTEYIGESKGKKTCIKPKLDPANNGMYKNLSKAYTNVIRIYLDRQVGKYIQDTQNFYNDLNSKLQKTNEPNWDYNRFVRSMKRYERKQQCEQ